MTDTTTFPTMTSPTNAAPSGSIRDDAAALGSKAANRLADTADQHKDSVVEPVREVSGAISAAADQLGGGQTPAWVADGLRSVADTVSGFAGRLENGDSRQLFTDVQNVARQHPGLFLAGCAAAGFAAARVLRAGAASSPSSVGDMASYGSADNDDGTGSSAMQADAATYTPPMGAGSL